MSAPTHTWRFFRAGGFDQVKLESGADLLNLDQLDQKLWVALACPASGLEFDRQTLSLIDSDKDGRVRAPELIAAFKWAGALLKNPDDLVKAGDSLPLSSINDSTAEGKAIACSARTILNNLGKKEATAITPSGSVLRGHVRTSSMTLECCGCRSPCCRFAATRPGSSAARARRRKTETMTGPSGRCLRRWRRFHRGRSWS